MHDRPDECFARMMFRLKNGKRWKVLTDNLYISENTAMNWVMNPGSVRLYDLRTIVQKCGISDAEIISWFRGKE